MTNTNGSDEDLKLVSFIQEGNLEGIKIITSKWGDEDYERLNNSHIYPLHLSTCSGYIHIVQHLLENTQSVIDCQNKEGSTALHLAVSQGNEGIVQLLTNKGCNVSLLDSEAKSAIDRAQNTAIKKILIDAQKKTQEKIINEVINLGREKRFSDLIKKYEDLSIEKLVPINVFDPENGRTLLHLAASANDEKFVRWLIQRKVDILIKDKKGKLPYDLATDKKIQGLLFQDKPSENQRLEGPLKKWVNLAVGYKERYFILEQGNFSYCKSQKYIEKGVRATMIMKNAVIHWKEGSLQFKVQSSGHIKFTLRAKNKVEAKLWVDALLNAKEIQIPKNSKKSHFDPSQRLSLSLSNASNRLNDDFCNINTPIFASRNSIENQPLSTEPILTEFEFSIEDSLDGPNIKATLMSIDAYADVQKRILNSIIAKDSCEKVQIPASTIGTLLESIEFQKNMINKLIQNVNKEHNVRRDVKEAQNEEQTICKNDLEHIANNNHESEELVGPQSKDITFYENEQTTTSINEITDVTSESVSREISKESQNNQIDEPEVCFSENKEFFLNAEHEIDASIPYESFPQKDQSKVDDTKSLNTDPIHNITSSYSGYPIDGDFRKELEMSGDIIPSISIWSILKNSVGKDLSKISVPVEFNEPTSMLQRMCEDMEYSELLDTASQQPESVDRMLWVAAFAMSNYSSTLGRTGKPFNPLLGETFEYIRPDRGFRYVSEQVSHHPPISACYCESPNYTFQAEVNLVSKFWGKSFELNPQGVTHLNLKLPSDNENKIGVDSISSVGEIQEHYTWTKVTSAMNNIIVGTMYIEHYGDMVIKNHRTGDECTLTFHRTGWRSSNKHVVRGIVRDANGKEIWEIGGRWDDKLIARRFGLNDGDLIDKSDKNKLCKLDLTPGDGTRPILLWKMTPPPKPHLAYRLTNFAVTLNQMTEGLQNYLPPTDSRHRPDQKAMERGDFSAANDLKADLENNQRQRRKGTDTKSYTPRWFTNSTDPDSNSSIWTFNSRYWAERHRCGIESLDNSQSAKWDNVLEIFKQL